MLNSVGAVCKTALPIVVYQRDRGSTWKRKKLKILQEKLQVKVLEKVEKKPFLPKCPCCKTGNLHRIAVFDQRGPPACYLGISQRSAPCKK
ncbi:hypothetical protein FBFR_11145 [Flavobacterium fryxellicola]|uniref:Uncharacterized protein n=1 Tax=Flavobacterium fryxellicola TaxID=249352 RepID=A0A167WH20_9FLAO|nr:hypothetical protein FBFR_11145 [Flavobacterium fryxellicola]